MKGIKIAPENERLGRRCLVPKLKGPESVKTLRSQSLQAHGVQLFNCLPTKLRNINAMQNILACNWPKSIR